MPNRNKRIGDLIGEGIRGSEISELDSSSIRRFEKDGKRYAEFEVSAVRQSPIERRYYREGLDFAGMNTEFINSGNAPVYWRHDRANQGDISNVVGTVVKTRTLERNGDKILMATVRFVVSDTDSERCFSKIESGLIRNVSLGYRLDWARVPADKSPVEWVTGPDARETCWLRYWEPREVSFVGLPADSSVGMGREAVKELKSILEVEDMPEKVKENRETETEEEPTGTDPEKVTREDGGETIPKKDPPGVETRMTLSEIKVKVKENMRGEMGDDDLEKAVSAAAREANGNPLTVDDVYREALKFRKTTGEEATSKVRGTETSKSPAVHTKDHHPNCGRLFEVSRSNGDLDNLDGLEREIYDAHNEANAKATRPDYGRASEATGGGAAYGIRIPHIMLVRDPAMANYFESRLTGKSLDFYRAAFAGGTTGFHVPVFQESLVFDALKENAPVLKAVNFLGQQLYQNKKAVRVGGATDFVFSTADDFGHDASGSLAFTNPEWAWKNLQGYLDMKVQATDQSAMIMPTVMSEKDRDFANVMDKFIINGAGGTKDVLGILRTPSIPEVEVNSAANTGGLVTYALLSKIRAKARTNNARTNNACWLMDGVVGEAFRTTPRLSGQGSTGGSGDAIVIGGGDSMTIDGQKLLIDTNMPNDLTDGTLQNLRAIIYGDLKDVHVGMFSEMEVLVDLFTQRASGIVRTWVRQAWDMVIGQPENFVICTDITND